MTEQKELTEFERLNVALLLEDGYLVTQNERLRKKLAIQSQQYMIQYQGIVKLACHTHWETINTDSQG